MTVVPFLVCLSQRVGGFAYAALRSARHFRKTTRFTVALLLFLSSCGQQPQAGFPDASTTTTGGAVFVDRSGDGQLSANDAPVPNVAVSPLRATYDEAQQPTGFSDDPNAAATTTNVDGSFALDYQVFPDILGVRVTMDAPSSEASATGQLSWLMTIDAESVENEIPIEHLPRSCSSSEDDCGRFLLPDLVPIIRWDEVDPGARSTLEPLSADPSIDGFLPVETWFIETDETGRRLLRFASVTANIGEGPLDVISAGETTPGQTTTDTWQRIWSDEWAYRDRRSGQFVFHEGHDHIHFDSFERYRLIDESGEVVAEAAKVSFCLRDSLRISDAPEPTIGIFGPASGCGAVQQAINPGYADHYNQFLPDQWIEITGVEPGTYTVEITVDPLGVIEESDETNNQGSFTVVID